MSRLLTDDQVERIVNQHASAIATSVVEERPDSGAGSYDEFPKLVQAIEHDLTETLEGLIESVEGRWS